MKDLNGRTYAKLSDCKLGTMLEAGGGFTCIPKGAIQQVHETYRHGLYIRCTHGQHFLDGQLDCDTQEYLIGLYPAPEPSL